jgi:hypothetical protein
VEQADVALLAEAVADGEVAGVASAVERAGGVQAAEARQVIHRRGSSGRERRAMVWTRIEIIPKLTSTQ